MSSGPPDTQTLLLDQAISVKQSSCQKAKISLNGWLSIVRLIPVCSCPHQRHRAEQTRLYRIQTALDFFNQINMLYGTITEFCSNQECPVMSAGPRCVHLLDAYAHEV